MHRFDMRAVARRLLALAAGLACVAALAQSAGQVHFVAGNVSVERGQQRLTVRANDPVLVGDIVATGADGHLQMRMSDAAFVSLRPNSRMAIREYSFAPDRPGEGSALLQLVSGVMRTFTGEIVAAKRERFRMTTPLASVGIRGSGNILAHLEGQGTLNHTLTGAHAVSASDPALGEATLVSYPGQTIEVLPGRPPRFVPTPRFILAASTAKPAGSKADEAGGEPALVASPAEAGPAAESLAAAGGVATTVAQASLSTTGAIVSAVVTATGREAFWRFATPLGGSGEFEGVLGQTGNLGAGGALINSDGQLVGAVNASMGTFLSGPGALPPGYAALNWAGEFRFIGGVHRDAYLSPDGSITMGRWEGGSVEILDAVAGRSSLDLGPRSIVYASTFPTPTATWQTFTGTTTYNMVFAVTPTDALGHAGSMTSATTTLNFSTMTATGSFALSINNQNFTATGSNALTATQPVLGWGFASALGTLSITCTGTNCAPSYQGTFNGAVNGPRGEFVSYIYRINPTRQPGEGFRDLITGGMVLQAVVPPGLAASQVLATLSGRGAGGEAAIAATARVPMTGFPRPIDSRRIASRPAP